MVIIPKFHYRWNSISTAGIRRLDFADLTVLRSPFGPYFRHSDGLRDSLIRVIVSPAVRGVENANAAA